MSPELKIRSSPGTNVPFFSDASVTIHQLVCFPIYGIPKVRRKNYLVFGWAI
jgi:hypothetical protein